MKYLLRFFIPGLFVVMIFAGPAETPKQEFRGVWLSTVANIDWPVNKEDSEAKKQGDLIRYLDTLKSAGINSVIFQVRPACDAMYASPYEPWSYWFSGKQDEGPPADSLWDPLAFAVTEAHKRGMELHAWVNPYRAVKDPDLVDSTGYLSGSHISKQKPEWILRFRDVHILDPGKTEVRDYITKIFMDIVTRYDIDGLHMDDYFYPYSGIENEDSVTFSEEPRDISNIHDWRRDNINLLVKAVSDSIEKVKPWVKWGISPFGIYRPGVPEGIEGFDAWSVLYCDPIAWLEAGTVDYITPQCYWPFGGGQDYGKLIPYWSEQARKYERHFYPGQALYRAASDKFPEGEIPRQIRLNRTTDGCQGSVYFTANNFFRNPKNSIDSMRLDLYEYPALWPVLPHREGRALPSPVLFAERDNGRVRLSWDPSEDAWGYVIYRSKTQKDLGAAENILTVTRDSSGYFTDTTPEQWFYAVTSLDPYKRESSIARAVYDFVVPLKPANNGKDTWGRVCFKWEPFAGAESYHIQVAADGNFERIIYQERLLSTTTLRKKLKKDMKYYWRIKADNNDVWSPVWSFSR